MEILKLDYLSKEVANKIYQCLSQNGIPGEDKIVVATPSDDTKVGGIIIPVGTAKDSIPKKGIVVHHGHISQAYTNQPYLYGIGNLVTYGIYSGKDIEFDYDQFPSELKGTLDDTRFTILSLNEIAYAENNPK